VSHTPGRNNRRSERCGPGPRKQGRKALYASYPVVIPTDEQVRRYPHPEFGVFTGFVFIRDFDLGMARSLIGVQEKDKPTSDSDRFFLTFPQFPADDQNATIIYKNPEPTLQWHQFPRVMISRDSVNIALERWHPITQEYMLPAPGTQIVSVPGDLPQETRIGPATREAKEQAWPFDITYTIEVWHRYANWAQAMIFRVMKSFPPYGKMKLLDSLNEVRTYDAFAEGGVTDLTEALSMTDRGAGLSWTVRVTGELDLADQVNLETVRQVNATLFRLHPTSGPFD